jgi:hypothetical protein
LRMGAFHDRLADIIFMFSGERNCTAKGKEDQMESKKDIFDIFMEWKIAPNRNEKNEITHYLAIQWKAN